MLISWVHGGIYSDLKCTQRKPQNHIAHHIHTETHSMLVQSHPEDHIAHHIYTNRPEKGSYSQPEEHKAHHIYTQTQTRIWFT